MRTPAVLLALAVLTASATDSDARGRRTKASETKKSKKKHKKAKKHTKVEAPTVDEDEQIVSEEAEQQDEAADADDDSDRPARKKKRKKARKARVHDEDADDEKVDDDENEDDRVALDMRDDGDELSDDIDEDEDEAAPLSARKHTLGKERDWHVAIGPYLWASAVDADVNIGSAKLGATIDFGDMTKHARYGIPIMFEAGYKRVTLYTDFMYGVVDVAGKTEAGPLMIDIKGTAKNLMMDNFLGVTVLGASETAMLSVEPRVGLRYQRTVISGAVDLSGSQFAPPSQVSGESDALVGGRVIVRPFRKLSLIGLADGRIFGSSVSTWSATIEAKYKFTSFVQAALAYRTLTTDSAQVGLEMYGPRLTIQATF